MKTRDFVVRPVKLEERGNDGLILFCSYRGRLSDPEGTDGRCRCCNRTLVIPHGSTK